MGHVLGTATTAGDGRSSPQGTHLVSGTVSTSTLGPTAEEVFIALRASFSDPSIEQTLASSTLRGGTLQWRDLARILAFTWGRRPGWAGCPCARAPAFPEDHQIGNLCEHEQYGLVCTGQLDAGESVSLVFTLDAVPLAAGPPSCLAAATKDQASRLLHASCTAVVVLPDGERIVMAGTEAGAMGGPRTSQFVQTYTDEGHTAIQRVEGAHGARRTALFVSADASQFQLQFDFQPEVGDGGIPLSGPFSLLLAFRAASPADHAPLMLFRDVEDPSSPPGAFGGALRSTRAARAISGSGMWSSWPRLRLEEKMSFIDVRGTRRRFASGSPSTGTAASAWHLRSKAAGASPPLAEAAMVVAHLPGGLNALGVAAGHALRGGMHLSATLRSSPALAEDTAADGWLRPEGPQLEGQGLRLGLRAAGSAKPSEYFVTQRTRAAGVIHEALHQEWRVDFCDVAGMPAGTPPSGTAFLLAPISREASALRRLRRMRVAHAPSLARSLCASRGSSAGELFQRALGLEPPAVSIPAALVRAEAPAPAAGVETSQLLLLLGLLLLVLAATVYVTRH